VRFLVSLIAIGALSVAFVLNRSSPDAEAADVQAAAPASNKGAAWAAFQSDADIKLAAAIRTAILNDPRVAGVSNSVTIVARGGVVTLQGRVNEKGQKDAVESDARGVQGVERVENLLVVPGG
jgi:osmotically-inducible protein OsmY